MKIIAVILILCLCHSVGFTGVLDEKTKTTTNTTATNNANAVQKKVIYEEGYDAGYRAAYAKILPGILRIKEICDE